MRDNIVKLVLLCVLTLSSAIAADWPKEVLDVLGNKVVVQKKAQRVILASGFNLVAISYIHEDPASLLVGWGSELIKFDPATYQQYLQAFPALATLPVIGSGSGDELSSEIILSLGPDLVIFDAWQASRSQALVELLGKTGIQVAFIDFYQSPTKHSLASIRLLGQLFDREDKASELIKFYQLHMSRLTSRLRQTILPHPRVLMHAYPGVWECCWSTGAAGIGEYITLFQGNNLGAAKFPSANGGQLNLEFLIQQDPEIYIATGHSGVNSNYGLPLGSGIDLRLSLRQLKKIITQPGFATFSAVKNGRVHGFWNYFSGSPLNIVGAEVLAKWIQPTLYQDIDPQKTMDELNQRFLPISLEGTYWLTLPH